MFTLEEFIARNDVMFEVTTLQFQVVNARPMCLLLAIAM